MDLIRCIKQKMDRVHIKDILGKIKQILFQSIELVLIVKKKKKKKKKPCLTLYSHYKKSLLPFFFFSLSLFH
jgi:hypothetical protein